MVAGEVLDIPRNLNYRILTFILAQQRLLHLQLGRERLHRATTHEVKPK